MEWWSNVERNEIPLMREAKRHPRRRRELNDSPKDSYGEMKECGKKQPAPHFGEIPLMHESEGGMEWRNSGNIIL